MNLRRSEKSKVLMMALSGAMFIFAASAPLVGQGSADFLSLQKHINKQVTVETQDGQVTGQLLRVEESRLVVYEAGKPKPIPQESVKKVTLHKSRHTAAWVAGTSAAGLGLGFLSGFSAFNNSKYANPKIATMTLYGAGVGAAAGFGLSRIGKRDELNLSIRVNDHATVSKHSWEGYNPSQNSGHNSGRAHSEPEAVAEGREREPRRTPQE